MSLLYVMLCSFVLSFLFIPLTIKISAKFNIAKPAKSVYAKPCIGGAGIYAAFFMAVASGAFFIKLPAAKVSIILSASFIIMLLGLVDDIKDLRPLLKVAGELLGIAIIIFFGFFTKISFVPEWVNMLITGIWLLFITNAFNLLDIMDGLASGLTIIIASSLMIIALINKDMFSCVMLAALIGAHLGFLKYNYPPAKVYMGDTGSLLTGFLLSIIAVNISYAPIERKIALLTPVLAMSLPVYDTLFLIVMRIKKRKPIFDKTDDHFALRLANMGHGARKSLWTMYLFGMLIAFLSIIVAFSKNLTGFIVLVIMCFIFILAGKKVGYEK